MATTRLRRTIIEGRLVSLAGSDQVDAVYSSRLQVTPPSFVAKMKPFGPPTAQPCLELVKVASATLPRGLGNACSSQVDPPLVVRATIAPAVELPAAHAILAFKEAKLRT